ncbi:hypothetical protein L3X38_005337 [Prunus dulcis]|uniref:RNase H type-1 domain-containing protein n=1 Tax=Prunus dulcis TaxID=3755 RepID=A0AAD4ZQS7_PRUDU|nr:hypothetical protein L3X38_005337 [Prunus dulcis]
MNCLSHVSSYATAIFKRNGRFMATSFLYRPCSWKRKLDLSCGVKCINLESTRFHVQLYSSRSKASSSKTPSSRTRRKSEAEPVVELEKDAFYVVRKGDIVGVYKSFSDCQAQLSSSGFCTLEFDGASKGNPGLAGAGAVLRADDGSLICKLHEGLGVRTNNVAEYRALILGLKYALKKGFTKIRVKGDSKLVCMQVQGLWKVRNQNMSDLCEEVKELKDKFLSFEISHVLRELNSEADAQANLAVRLTDGQVQEEEFGK